MKNKTIIKIGLAFPNALFIGVLFILPAILVIKSVLLDGFDSVSSSMLIMSIFFPYSRFNTFNCGAENNNLNYFE
jgi:hypothetical protein